MQSLTNKDTMLDHFICEACNKYCGTKRAYKKHQESDTHRTKVGLPPLRYPCPSCHTSFTRRNEIRRHVQESRCSGSKTEVDTGASGAVKHRLSDVSSDLAWKRCRSRSPHADVSDDTPRVLSAQHDSAGVDISTHADGGHFRISDGMPGVADHQLVQNSSEAQVLSKIIEVYTCDTDVNDNETPKVQSSRKPADLDPSEDWPLKDAPQAVITEDSKQTTLSKPLAETMDYDIAKSIRTLSVTEEITTNARSGTRNRISSLRISHRSSRLRDSDRLSTYANSVGSLFGHSGASIRMPSYMRSSVRSLLSGYRSSAFSNEMPAPMGEHIDDELRWARESQGKHDDQIRESNGRTLVRDAAAGDYRSVYDNLMYSDVDINYLPSARNPRTAVGEAVANGHVKVLDAIVRAFTLTVPRKHSHLRMAFLRDHKYYHVIPNATTEDTQEWDDLNSSLRVMIASVSCLCPEEARSGTICERVASGQRFHLGDTKSECLWGDKLLQTNWPNMSKLVSLPTLELQREFLRSLGLNGFFIKHDEHVKTQAHGAYLEVALCHKRYQRLQERKLKIQEDLQQSHAPQQPDPISSLLGHETFELESRRRQSLREQWLHITSELEAYKAQHAAELSTSSPDWTSDESLW
jgi:hypothetical protein